MNNIDWDIETNRINITIVFPFSILERLIPKQLQVFVLDKLEDQNWRKVGVHGGDLRQIEILKLIVIGEQLPASMGDDDRIVHNIKGISPGGVGLILSL